MRNIIVSSMALVLAAGVVKAQSKPAFKYGISEITVKPFEKISINAKIDVVLVQNDTLHTVYVEGDENLLKQISVVSENGELTINGNKSYTGIEKLQVIIPVKKIRRMDISSEARLVARNESIF